MGRHDRLHSSATDDQRDPFQRDRDRILYSEALRRLQGVTQVISADEGVVVHNRLGSAVLERRPNPANSRFR